MAALLLLTEIQLFLPLPRLAQLTNADLPSNSQTLAVTGTCSVTNGSAAVVGTTTAFTGLTVGNVIAFSSQPNVNYTIAGVTDDAHLTLAVPFTGATTASATALTAGINYQTLQLACNYAGVEFTSRTGLAWDNVTVTDLTATPPVINKCTWAGWQLVLAYLYKASGSPLAASAQKAAEDACDIVLHTWGNGAWAPPVSDSVYNPSVGPTRLPDFDTARLGQFLLRDPGAGAGWGGGSGVSGVPNDWVGP